MIQYKTAVLVAAAMKMGAIVAETTIENANLIYDFGLNLCLAFQLQDDYLDAFGDPATFGRAAAARRSDGCAAHRDQRAGPLR